MHDFLAILYRKWNIFNVIILILVYYYYVYLSLTGSRYVCMHLRITNCRNACTTTSNKSKATHFWIGNIHVIPPVNTYRYTAIVKLIFCSVCFKNYIRITGKVLICLNVYNTSTTIFCKNTGISNITCTSYAVHYVYTFPKYTGLIVVNNKTQNWVPQIREHMLHGLKLTPFHHGLLGNSIHPTKTRILTYSKVITRT